MLCPSPGASPQVDRSSSSWPFFLHVLKKVLCKLRSSQSLLFSLKACLMRKQEHHVQRSICSSLEQEPAFSSHVFRAGKMAFFRTNGGWPTKDKKPWVHSLGQPVVKVTVVWLTWREGGDAWTARKTLSNSHGAFLVPFTDWRAVVHTGLPPFLASHEAWDGQLQTK